MRHKLPTPEGQQVSSFTPTVLAEGAAAQALMRHSDPKLTAKTYTKLGITDLGAVVSRLPTTVSGEQAAEKQGEVGR